MDYELNWEICKWVGWCKYIEPSGKNHWRSPSGQLHTSLPYYVDSLSSAIELLDICVQKGYDVRVNGDRFDKSYPSRWSVEIGQHSSTWCEDMPLRDAIIDTIEKVIVDGR